MKLKGTGLAFDDVLLIPRHSNIKSRNSDEIDISTALGEGKRAIKLDIPIISANMPSVTEEAMAREIADLGGLAILHRFNNIYQIEAWKKLINTRNLKTILNHVALSVGVHDETLIKTIAINWKETTPKIWCIDVAHGHHDLVKNTIKQIRDYLPEETLIIAGNVATRKGAEFLMEAGADVIKIGIGSGSTCSTRVETGNGVPQITALDEVSDLDVSIISDGGIREGGDITKAMCFADAVMLGNVLAGTDEAPGEKVSINGKFYKPYRGSSTYKPSNVEGVSGMVPYRGPVKNVIKKLMDGLKSGMSYQGAHNFKELAFNAEFMRISSAGLTESKPHDIWMIQND